MPRGETNGKASVSEWHKNEFEAHELEALDGCDLCGGPDADAKALFAKQGLTVRQCASCGLMYVSPRLRPHILWQRYERTYFENEYLPQHCQAAREAGRSIHKAPLRELVRHAGGRGRLLDVGCATGLFLAAARADGWDVVGSELSSFAALYAGQQMGIPVHAGAFEALELAPGTIDAVTLWDTLEHVQSPRAVLEKAFALLRPGGALALTTPNVGGLTYACLRDRWWQVAPKEHIFYFAPRTLVLLLERCGFAVKALYTTAFDPRYFVNAILGRQVKPWPIHAAEQASRADPGRPPATRDGPLAAFAGLLRKVAVAPAARLLGALRLTDTINAYATRRGKECPIEAG